MSWFDKIAAVLLRERLVRRTPNFASWRYHGMRQDPGPSSPFVIGIPKEPAQRDHLQLQSRKAHETNILEPPETIKITHSYRDVSPSPEPKVVEHTQDRMPNILLLESLKKPFMAEATLPPLSEEQAKIVEAVKRGANLFFTGPAGSGKTLIVSHIKQYLEEQRIPFAVTAPTGVAALLLGGKTIHSWARVGKGDQPIFRYLEMSRHGSSNAARRNEFKATKVLIIDEISMVSSDLFMKVNALMKEVRRNNAFMGGMQVVVCGDFFQLPPVVIESDRTCYQCGTLVDSHTDREYLPHDDEKVLSLDPYLEKVGVSNWDWTVCSRMHPRTKRKCGHLWNPTMTYAYQTLAWLEAKFEYFTLSKVYRQEEQDWIDMLAKIKKGEGFHDGKISAVLDGLKRPLPTLASGIIPTILHTHRSSAALENRLEYQKLRGNEVSYPALDSGAHVMGLSDSEYKILRRLQQKDFIEEPFFKNVSAQETLTLKPGTQVMLLTNLSTKLGLVNGSRGIVTSFRYYTRAELDILGKERLSMLFGNDKTIKDATIPIPLVTFIPPPSNPSLKLENIPMVPHIFDQNILQPEGYHLRLKRVQFPLAWAWATTIHKCQGMSLDYARINIEKTFVPGQGYVALSRVRNTKGLQIVGQYDNWSKVFFTSESVEYFMDHLEETKEKDADCQGEEA